MPNTGIGNTELTETWPVDKRILGVGEGRQKLSPINQGDACIFYIACVYKERKTGKESMR